jgi:adenine-specific DNA methylase
VCSSDLIEVDLRIKEISKQARREKSIRHGHISTLHIWWARRPLASCRAILCAGLWLDPADDLAPPEYRTAAANIMAEFRDRIGGEVVNYSDPVKLRNALVDFIAEYSNWDNCANEVFNNTARKLTEASHSVQESLNAQRPLVLDPFAGGGAIPL